MTDIPGNLSTTASVTVGSTTNGSLEVVGDNDWFKISLTAGQAITVTINGVTLEDPYLVIHNSAGASLYENDDINTGIIRDSKVSFTASSTGVYYIDVGGFEDSYAGTYQLVVSNYTPPPLFTVDQIADQLVNGYWGGDDHHFDVSQGGTIDVNLGGLTANGQFFARAALDVWSDVIGVTFREVSTGGQIIFDDDQPGAMTNANWSGGIIEWATVNVSTDWISTDGTNLNSYSLQTFIHEIGHALGLGHAGDYNGDATYSTDALFENDAWSTSIMSYFSPNDNTYFGGQGFSEDFSVTPMMADIVAMQALYGLSTITRTGNTTYGFNSNADRSIYHADLFADVAFTIFDSGGTDTLDYSGFGGAQRINLNPETFSNVDGNTGNVSIGRGVVIENAIGGAGADTLVGNAANNVLNGGAGTDIVSYEAASAGVTVSLATAGAQSTGGAGSDTLVSIEQLVGSAFGDRLTGNSGLNILNGGAGNDTLDGGAGGDTLIGGSGNDTYVVDQSNDSTSENSGEGTDLVKASISWILGANVESLTLTGSAAINGTGNSLDNVLTGNSGVNKLIGNAGNDALNGGAGVDRLIGGTGNDTYYVDEYNDAIVENAGEGTDSVFASASYKLRANVEALTLSGSSNIWGYGNELANQLTGNGNINKLYGLAGNDTIDGGAGTDRMTGGTGNDTYFVDNYGDRAIESLGEGTDSIFAGANYVMGANVENLTVTGSANLWAYGNDGANSLTGNTGANKLFGKGGNDVVNGGAGNDTLEGGSGQDQLTGGAGSDSFVFRDGDFAGLTTSTCDQVKDFATGDRIKLNFVDSNTLLAADQAFAFVGTAVFSHTAGELRYEQISGNTYLSGDTNGDGAADFMIQVDGLHTIHTADLVL